MARIADRKAIRRDEVVASLLKQSSSKNKAEALEALDKIAEMASENLNKKLGFMDYEKEAEALEVNNRQMIQEAVFDGDIFSDIFTVVNLGWDEQPMFPMDLVTPGEEGDYVAYTMPNTGRIPNRHVEGDEVTINTYRIANSIDFDVKYARAGRIDVLQRALQVLRDGFVMKMNDDAWHTILGAGLDRGIMVFDSNASAGTFTKALLQLLTISMMRNGGGNSASMNRYRLTDLYVSPEAMEDIRSWTDSIVSEATRREIELNVEGTIMRLFGVNIHVLTELGENQKYTNYYEDQLGGSLSGTDVELVVGMDLSDRSDFIMPVRGNGIEITADDSMSRSGTISYYGSAQLSFGILNSKRIILGSF